MGCSHSKRSKTDVNPADQPSLAPEALRAAVPPQDQNEENFVEEVICKEEDLAENEMKVFPIWKEEDGCEVLLVKQNGQISALGPKCTHYGAPLVKSALGDGRLRCQWHGACFNIANGDIEDFPGMDSLPCYQVTVSDGQVKVKADKKSLKSKKRAPVATKRDAGNKQTFIVVGGGPSGAVCVDTLRGNGFTGRLVFVTGEPNLPYDRIKLSKGLDVDVNKILLRPKEFYEERDIELKLGVQLTAISPATKSITLSNSETISYDKIYLATGSSARRIPALGSDLKNIFVLRTAEDAEAINSAIKPESNVVVLGSSFIGLEIAAYCVSKVKSVIVLGRENVPFKASLGESIGTRVKALFEEKGVKFHLEQGIKEYQGDVKVEKVVLNNGTVLDADVVIQGVGVVPNTQFLADAGLGLEKNRSVRVNEYLETKLDGVYAGGDIAYAPVLDWDASIGHWGLASYHGRVAAHNMLGKAMKLETVPFFWTMLFGKGFRYCGFAPSYTSVEIRGDLQNFAFVACYVLDTGKVGAVLTCGRDPIAAAFGERLKQKKTLSAADIDDWLATF